MILRVGTSFTQKSMGFSQGKTPNIEKTLDPKLEAAQEISASIFYGFFRSEIKPFSLSSCLDRKPKPPEIVHARTISEPNQTRATLTLPRIGPLENTVVKLWSASPKPHPSKPHPCNQLHAKTKVALQLSECCAAEVALQHSLFCNAEAISTKSRAAANEKLHCNIEKAALQESGAFLPLSCGFQAPTFRHPRFGLADLISGQMMLYKGLARLQLLQDKHWLTQCLSGSEPCLMGGWSLDVQ